MSKLPSLPSYEMPPDPIKDEIRQLVHRLAGSSSPDAADVEALAKHIRAYPEVASFFPDLDQYVEERILTELSSSPIRRTLNQTQITRMTSLQKPRMTRICNHEFATTNFTNDTNL